MECHVCHRPIATFLGEVAPGERWIHSTCYGNHPTTSDLVMAFVAAFPDEAFCVTCLGELVGTVSRQDIADAVVALAGRLTIAPGTCARCSANDDVIAARPEMERERSRSRPAREPGSRSSRRK